MKIIKIRKYVLFREAHLSSMQRNNSNVIFAKFRFRIFSHKLAKEQYVEFEVYNKIEPREQKLCISKS
jgi:hypothetical protein